MPGDDEQRVGDDLDDLIDLEIRLLLDGLHARYGYDFRAYAPASVRRRVLQAVAASGLRTVSALQDRTLHDPSAFAALLGHLTIPTTALFRDPEFYRALREHVLPHLATYPSIKVWSAGCSTGEEAWSLAILFAEEALLGRALIYATDINRASLATAARGVYRVGDMQAYTANYQRAGGRRSLADYYRVEYGGAMLDRALAEHIVFSEHSLAADAVFSEVHLVVCRNVLIYFQPILQRRAVGLFLESLTPRGFLALGSRETLQFTGWADAFEVIDRPWRIYRKR